MKEDNIYLIVNYTDDLCDKSEDGMLNDIHTVQFLVPKSAWHNLHKYDKVMDLQRKLPPEANILSISRIFPDVPLMSLKRVHLGDKNVGKFPKLCKYQ